MTVCVVDKITINPVHILLRGEPQGGGGNVERFPGVCNKFVTGEICENVRSDV